MSGTTNKISRPTLFCTGEIKCAAIDLLERIRKQAERRREAIARKIHPALPIILRHYADFIRVEKALGRNPEPAKLEEIHSKMSKSLDETLKALPPLPSALGDVVYALKSERFASIQYLHFRRHGRSLAQDMEEANSNNPRAWKRILRTHEDYSAIMCGGGPLKASKADEAHSDIFLYGIGLGLEALSGEELADFFSEYCWCGKAHDSADSLKKQRTRMLRHFFK